MLANKYMVMAAKPKPGIRKKIYNLLIKMNFVRKKKLQYPRKFNQVKCGDQKKNYKNMRSLFKVFLNVGFCCFVSVFLFILIFYKSILVYMT